jgi:hypothetical protein
MGWSLALLKNTVELTEETFKLLQAADYDELLLYSDDEFDPRYPQLPFNSDHQEHMDWLSKESHLVQVLIDHKVNGEVHFADVESGDGTFWGYSFVDGTMIKLTGELVWSRDDSE